MASQTFLPPAAALMPLAMLGNISAQQFLNEFWQKKPLLIRDAFGKNFAPLTDTEILTLAGYDEAESRLVSEVADKWQLEYGPFTPARFRALAKKKAPPSKKWTVLIQDTQHFSYEAHQLLSNFNFLPQTRVDDLMVSYANEGGGVGPHVDSYDVFLLQGSGERQWQISGQKNLAFKAGLPLKILSKFKAEETWTLKEGDMLYLPPGYAHHGVAVSEVCVTWSIGFRAPTNQELLETWLDDVRDSISVAGRVTDEVRDQSRMSLKPTNSTNHAAIASALSSQVADTISRAIATTLTPRALAEFTGRYFTQAKSHVVFDLPEKELLQAAFIKRACKDGLVLDLRTRMLHDQSTIYVNGDMFVVDKKGHTLFAQFANSRVLDSDILKSATSDAVEALYAQWVRGYWHFYN